MHTWTLSASQGIVQGELCECMTFCVCSCIETFIFSCCQWVPVGEISVYILGILVGLCLSLSVSAHIATYLNIVQNQTLSCLPHILSPFLSSTILFYL